MKTESVLFGKKKDAELAEDFRRDAVYESARRQMTFDTVDGYRFAIQKFREIRGWKDADELIAVCERIVKEIEAMEEPERLERERKAEEARIAKEQAARKRKKAIAVAAPIALVCIVLAILLTVEVISTRKLNKALELIDSREYEAAGALLEELGGRRSAAKRYDHAMKQEDAGNYAAAYVLLRGLENPDSAAVSERVRVQYQEALFTKAEVGSYVMLGSWEQDNTVTNGKEDIEWLVLAKDGSRILVISRYGLECRKYHDVYAYVTWETCALRSWLNDTFFNEAFRADERERIQNTSVTADPNPMFDTPPGRDTVDRIFLLSIPEVQTYFGSDTARQCTPTAYAQAWGSFTHFISGTCWWWLRSPGDRANYAAYVLADGTVFYSGAAGVGRGSFTVRPAMWIDIGE